MAGWVRYMVTPSQLTSAGVAGSKPVARSLAVSSPRSKSAGTKAVPSGIGIPAWASWARFHSWVAGWSTSKTRRPAGLLRRYAKESSPAPRITYWVMPWAAAPASRSSVYRLRQVTWVRAADSTGCSPCAR